MGEIVAITANSANGQMGKWANGQMGKWANGQMGKWANAAMKSRPALASRERLPGEVLPCPKDLQAQVC
jgi:hypothetical protein